MTVLQVYDYLTTPKPLRRRAREVRLSEFATPAFEAFLDDLGETMAHHRALGLAATQVEAREGARPDNPDEVWRVFVMRMPDRDTYVVAANPHVEAREQVTDTLEGCLSFRSVHVRMRGPARVLVRHQEADGIPRAGALNGQLAVCYVHELEHLNGRTMVDRMKSGARQKFLAEVAKARRAP